MRAVRKFIKQYPSELVGYTALYRLGEKVGLPDMPKPRLSGSADNTPAPFIQAPVADAIGYEETKGAEIPEAPVIDVRQRLMELNKTTLLALVDKYNNEVFPNKPPGSVPPKIGAATKNASKQKIAEALINRDYNITTGEFGMSSGVRTPPGSPPAPPPLQRRRTPGAAAEEEPLFTPPRGESGGARAFFGAPPRTGSGLMVMLKK